MLAARNGSWLTAGVVRAGSGIAVGLYVCVFVALLFSGLQRTGDAGPVAADFSQVWAAGHAVLLGHPLAPYDLGAHAANLRLLFGPRSPPYVWVYPPFCLAAAAVLACMPYLIALTIEQGLTLALYARSIHSLLPNRLALLCALALPSVVINLVYGQLGALTAGLGGLAASCLVERPLLAGVCFGCMAYKPQLGLAVPLALVAGRYWSTIAAAAVTLACLVLGSVAAYGWQSWIVFASSLRVAGAYVFSRDAVGWYKLESAYAAARLLGAEPALAWVAQGSVVLAVFIAVVWLWWHDHDRRLKMALLLVAGLLCTPYCFEYDLVILGPVVALLVSHGLDRGFLPWQKTLLTAFGFIPLVEGPVAHYVRLPIGFLSIAACASFIVLRASRDARCCGMLRPG